MDGVIFDCPKEWTWLLPPAVSRMEQADLLVGRVWDLLALTETGCKQLRAASCRTLLVPGDLDPAVLQWIQAERVITELTLEKLKKADDPSPFPALTQIEVYGREAEKL